MNAETTAGDAGDGAAGDKRLAVGRTLLCILDDTDEVSIAIQFAARRAARTGAHVGLLYVIDSATEFQHWSSVGELMRAEATAKAERVLARAADQVRKWIPESPIFYIREGNRRDEVIKQVHKDPTISFLVLGAATGRDGPGPLVTSLTGRSVGQLRVPIVIIPGNMSEDEIASFA
jgi:nucleotide-binding universal stress UspA family protein